MQKVVSIGSSLGGAASLLGEKPIEVNAYILETVYPSIEAAVQNRSNMRAGKIGEYFAPLLYKKTPID